MLRILITTPLFTHIYISMYYSHIDIQCMWRYKYTPLFLYSTFQGNNHTSKHTLPIQKHHYFPFILKGLILYLQQFKIFKKKYVPIFFPFPSRFIHSSIFFFVFFFPFSFSLGIFFSLSKRIQTIHINVCRFSFLYILLYLTDKVTVCLMNSVITSRLDFFAIQP